MNFRRLGSSILRSARLLVVMVACALMLFSSAFPAYAASGNMIGSQKSNAAEGEAQLDDIYQKSEDALKAEPRSMGEVQDEASKGPNEVQGGADVNKMNRPDNSQGATSVPDQIEKAFDNLLGK